MRLVVAANGSPVDASAVGADRDFERRARCVLDAGFRYVPAPIADRVDIASFRKIGNRNREAREIEIEWSVRRKFRSAPAWMGYESLAIGTMPSFKRGIPMVIFRKSTG
jgi:hypothetical protein